MPSIISQLPQQLALGYRHFRTELETHPMLIGLATILVVFTGWYVLVRDPRRKRMPPLAAGPPIINQTFQHLEPEFPKRLMQWTQEYGPIFRTKSAATDFIWLSSPQAVKDIIDRRSAQYSSRQPQPMALGAASGGRRMTFMQKGRRWRTMRTIVHRVIVPFSAF
jgi:cytochrome P450